MKADDLDLLDGAIRTMRDTITRPLDHALAVTVPELDADPIGILSAVRRTQGPVLAPDADGRHAGLDIPISFVQPEGTPIYHVLGWDEAREVLADHDVFLNGDGAQGVLAEAFGGRGVIFLDGEEHTEHRKMLIDAFNRGAIGRMVDDLIDPIATHLVDRLVRMLEAGESVCAARDLGLPMAFKVITDFLGLPSRHFSEFLELSADAFNAPSDMERAFAAVMRITEMWTEELAKRRSEPGDDLLTWLTQTASPAGRRFTDEEIVEYARVLLPAGVDTTSRQIPTMLIMLLSEAGAWADIVADPELIDAAIDEVMRTAPAVLHIARRASVDCAVGGVDIPAGASVIVWTSVANRDPAAFERPDEFDIHRARKTNLGFSVGRHHCIGSNLARTEMRVLLEKLVAEVPDLRLAQARQDIVLSGLGVRSPRHVPLTR